MKSEKQKMLDGEPYDYADTELISRWHYAHKLMNEYNGTPTTEPKRLGELLDGMLGSRGKGVWIAPPFFVDYGENIHIGNNVEINMNCVFLDCNRITIGDNSGIGPAVQIYAVSHPVNPAERICPDTQLWVSTTAPVTIGRNVWIGGGTVILPGVTIGDNCTIGAGSVVSRSIPAGSLAVGNPCRVIRKVDDEQR